MLGPYPKVLREVVVALARRREIGVTIKQIATDFGISKATSQNHVRSIYRYPLNDYANSVTQGEVTGGPAAAGGPGA